MARGGNIVSDIYCLHLANLHMNPKGPWGPKFPSSFCFERDTTNKCLIYLKGIQITLKLHMPIPQLSRNVMESLLDLELKQHQIHHQHLKVRKFIILYIIESLHILHIFIVESSCSFQSPSWMLSVFSYTVGVGAEVIGKKKLQEV